MGDYLAAYTDGDPLLNPWVGEATLESMLADLDTPAEREAAVDQAVDSAEATVNGYIGTRYQTPVSSPGEEIVDATGVLAVRNLYARGHGWPEDFGERVEEVMQWLRDVAAGKANVPSGVFKTESATTGGVRYYTEDRKLVRDDLQFF
jgi:phage gp36-like protein